MQTFCEEPLAIGQQRDSNQGSRTLLYGVIETEIRWLLMSVLNVGNCFSLRRFGT
jgi:hypothetical protein